MSAKPAGENTVGLSAPDLTMPPPEPFLPAREQYTAQVTGPDGNGWPVVQVSVLNQGELVYEYERRYRMLHTFEPFRQLRDGRWHDYALISPNYTTFQVLDLSAGKVVAERPMPKRVIPESWFQTHPDWFLTGGHYAGVEPGDLIDGEGFCPNDFFVPDPVVHAGVRSPTEWNRWSCEPWFAEEMQFTTGHHGFYSGCVWGDDSSMKLRTIDLSQISEGVVSDAEPFGYLELPDRGRLSEHVSLDDGYPRISVSVPVDLKAGARAFVRDHLRWDDSQQH